MDEEKDYVTLDQLDPSSGPSDSDIMLLQQPNGEGKSVTVGQLKGHATSDIDKLIPDQANENNKLADKNYVNSSIATNTATYRGDFNSVEELEAYSGEKTNNDYAFVKTTDETGNVAYNRYKWNTEAWIYEYTLNNSSFTAEQWAAIQSGITAEKVAQINEIKISQQPGNAIEEKSDGIFVDASSSWTGTEAAWEALDKSTLKDKQQINITDQESVIYGPDVVVESGHNANGHYRKWKSGLIEQWGSVSVANETVKTISLPTAFIEDEDTYNVIIQACGNTSTSNNQYWNSQEVTDKTGTNFTFKFAQGQATSFDWQAKGN